MFRFQHNATEFFNHQFKKHIHQLKMTICQMESSSYQLPWVDWFRIYYFEQYSKKMTTLETINLLQIISLILVGFILYMLGFLHGSYWKRRNGV